MARITVEDCKKEVENSFDLVLIASARAKSLNSGMPSKIETDATEKNTVIALREIAQGELDIARINDSIIESFRKNVSVERMVSEDLNIESQEEYLEDTASGYVSAQEDMIEDQEYPTQEGTAEDAPEDDQEEITEDLSDEEVSSEE